MNTGLESKRALVLGSSKGLGFGIAQGLAGEGATVAVASRTMEGSRAAAEKIGGGVLPFVCDTGKVDQVDALVADVMKTWGGVDILVLNSGGPTPGKAQGVASDQWRLYFDSMFVNLVRIADQFLPGMIERKFGRIISVVSSGVIQPIPNLAISNTIRPALIGWGKTLSAEVASAGVTVNAIAPGRIATDRVAQLDKAAAERTSRDIEDVKKSARDAIPAGRYGTIEEFGAAAVFLASQQASFMTGSILRVDGGQITAI
jgi:3-oxoacyl-[acyl-carrier protein] reductase